MNKQMLGTVMMIFLFAGIGAQVDYLVFGLVHFIAIVLLTVGLSWLRHKNVRVSLLELLIMAVSGALSIVAGKMVGSEVASVEVSIAFKLLSLCSITMIAWWVVPDTIKKHWCIV